MTKFRVSGSNIMLANELDNVILDKLPPHTYNVAFHIELGFYLTRSPDFTLPPKLYGNTAKVSERILRTFQDRSNSTGVLLVGTKGSGKSLAMKKTALDGQALGIPVIIVGSAFKGDAFNKFIQSIEQEAILIFDEFEKVYDKDDQNVLLTLFDGIFSSKKLFLLTVNDKYGMNEYMQNRPGRIYYYLEYKGLETQFIREYCEDKLKNPNHLEQILQYSGLFKDFNFDMLQALVEELNRYDETVKEALSILNIKYDGYAPLYNAVFYDVDGKEIDEKHAGPRNVRNLFSQPKFNYRVLKKGKKPDVHDDTSSEWFDEDADEDEWEGFSVSTVGAHVTKSSDLSVVTIVSEKHKIVLTRELDDYQDHYGVL